MFDLDEAVTILSRTPGTLRALLDGLSAAWLDCDEGSETWSPFVVVGHLIHGERADWMPRARIILAHGESRTFDVFDRFAQLEESNGKELGELLDEFEGLRRLNLAELRKLALSPEDLQRTGRHPDLGVVNLGQLLATWTAHDLGHIAQIGRVMAKRYTVDVGPWGRHLPILRDRLSG